MMLTPNLGYDRLMGLREKKAVRLRQRIVSEALALFRDGGYEQTTMEAIAEVVEISPSTLYRYFPSKDLIVLFPFSSFAERFCDVFVLHSTRHSIDEALAEAIFTVLAFEDRHREETLLTRSILERSPAARAHLWDFLGEQERQLRKLLAERLNTKENEPRVIATARLANMIVRMAADMWRAGDGQVSSCAIAEDLMRLFREGMVILPRPSAHSQFVLSREAGSPTPSGTEPD